MNAVVPLFLLAPLVVVPFGYRLIEVVAPGAKPPSLASLAVLPAAISLVVAFGLAPGPAAGVLALPWVALTGGVAAAVVMGRLRRRRRWHLDPETAVDAALAFLAVGAVWAAFDRAGIQPLGYDATIILLTAVHFHYAGFALVLVGALTASRSPGRASSAGVIAVVVGIPLTALGFLGVPGANWTGAMLTAVGGLTIGISLVRVATGFSSRSALALGRIAGAALLISMPLAVAYATSTALGISGPDIELMARVHGSLNALGFALPAIAAWTIASRERGERRRSDAGPLRQWAIGLLVGVVVAFGIFLGGLGAALLSFVAVLALGALGSRLAALGGFLLAFGAVWSVALLGANTSCSVDCVSPDLRPWIAVTILLLTVGAVATARSLRAIDLRREP